MFSGSVWYAWGQVAQEERWCDPFLADVCLIKFWLDKIKEKAIMMFYSGSEESGTNYLTKVGEIRGGWFRGN